MTSKSTKSQLVKQDILVITIIQFSDMMAGEASNVGRGKKIWF